MNKLQVKFKNLKEDQTIQIIDLDDYFGDGITKISKPTTKIQFIKEHLQDIMDDEDVEEANDRDKAFAYLVQGSGDGDSNKVYVTIEGGVVKIIQS